MLNNTTVVLVPIGYNVQTTDSLVFSRSTTITDSFMTLYKSDGHEDYYRVVLGIIPMLGNNYKKVEMAETRSETKTTKGIASAGFHASSRLLLLCLLSPLRISPPLPKLMIRNCGGLKQISKMQTRSTKTKTTN